MSEWSECGPCACHAITVRVWSTLGERNKEDGYSGRADASFLLALDDGWFCQIIQLQLVLRSVERLPH